MKFWQESEKRLMADNATFFDFGSSSGGSIEFAKSRFGGNGQGIDSDPIKIERLKNRGYDGIVADVTDVSIEDNSVNYVTMMNFLEHLPNQEVGERVIDGAVRVATDFVFMMGPNFDFAGYLRKHGLRKYFSKWSGHTWEHQISEFKHVLDKHSSHKCVLLEFDRIFDSNDHYLIPVDHTRNSGMYDPSVHSQKKFTRFTKARVYRWTAFVVVKNPNLSPEQVLFAGLLSNKVSYRSK